MVSILAPASSEPGICADGIDNDSDNKVDCAEGTITVSYCVTDIPSGIGFGQYTGLVGFQA
jgi:hypothetical protein